MMSIPQILKSWLWELYTRMQSPERMMTFLVQNLERHQIKSEKNLIAAIANEAYIEDLLVRNRKEATEAETRAKQWLKADQEDKARLEVARRNSYNTTVETLTEQLGMQKEIVQDLKASNIDLEIKLNEVKIKKEVLLTQMNNQTSRAVLISAVKEMQYSPTSVMRQVEDKVGNLRRLNNAAQQVYTQALPPGNSSNLDDDIAALKAMVVK